MAPPIKKCLSGKSYDCLMVVLGYFLETLIHYLIPTGGGISN